MTAATHHPHNGPAGITRADRPGSPMHAVGAEWVTSPTRRRRGRPSGRPLLADLDHRSVRTIADQAPRLWDTKGVAVGDISPLLAAIADISQWAESHDIRQINQLVDQPAHTLLRDLTGTPDLDSPQDHEIRTRLHLLRVALAALRFTALLTRSDLTTTRSKRSKNDSILADLGAPPALTDQLVRPLTDPEILLTRLLTLLDLHEESPTQPVIRRALAESGLALCEVTRIRDTDLNDRRVPTTVEAPGRKDNHSRTVQFEAFTTAVLTQAFAIEKPAVDAPLCYRGTQGSKAAAASLDDTLRHHLHRAGILAADVTPSSLTLWRPSHVLRTQNDLDQAAEIAGLAPRSLLTALRLYPDDDVTDSRRTVTTPDGLPVAALPADQVRHALETPKQRARRLAAETATAARTDAEAARTELAAQLDQLFDPAEQEPHLTPTASEAVEAVEAVEANLTDTETDRGPRIDVLPVLAFSAIREQLTGYAVLDLETTGPNPAPGHRAVQLAVIALDPDLNEVNRFNTLLNPQRNITNNDIHGLTDADVATAPTFSDIATALLEIIGDRVLVAHNAPFDTGFLTAELKRANRLNVRLSAVCTMQLAAAATDLRQPTLTELAEYYAVPHQDRHTALGDALTLAAVLPRLLGRHEPPTPKPTTVDTQPADPASATFEPTAEPTPADGTDANEADEPSPTGATTQKTTAPRTRKNASAAMTPKHSPARPPTPGTPAPGKPWTRPRGRDRWVLSKRHRLLLRKASEVTDEFAEHVGKNEAKRVVEGWLRIRPEGGRIFIDEEGHATTQVSAGSVIYLGRVRTGNHRKTSR